jgi:hypothetical protein
MQGLAIVPQVAQQAFDLLQHQRRRLGAFVLTAVDLVAKVTPGLTANFSCLRPVRSRSSWTSLATLCCSSTGLLLTESY